MNQTDLDVMARTIYGEARGESRDGMIAVAWVIKNRSDNPGWWGNGVADVCRKPWQFSCWNENDPNRQKLTNVTIEDPRFRDCLMVTAGVLSGNYEDNTGGSNHYCTKNLDPKWSIGEQPVAYVGNHKFYKL